MEDTKNMSIEELVRLPLQMFFISSNDGQFVYFYSNKTGKNEIYQFSTKEKSLRKLTNGEAPKTPRFPMKISKDDKYLFYLKDPVEGNEKYNIYSFNVETGKESQITDTPNSMDLFIDTMNNNSEIIFISDRMNSITQIFKANRDGSKVEQLTHHNNHVDMLHGDIKISHDGKFIIYTTNESSITKNGDLWKYSFDKGTSEKILSLSEGSFETVSCWAKDDNSVVIGTDKFGYQKVGILNISTNEFRWFGSKEFDEEFANFYEDNNEILVLRYDGAITKIVAYNIHTNSERELKLPSGINIPDRKILPGLRFLIKNSNSNHRLRALLYDLQSDTYEEIIRSEHGNFSENDFYKGEYIFYESEKGIKIYSLLYYPKTKENSKFPAIIVPHGGPTGQYFDTFMENAQVFCNSGYVLLFPNVRGSTGYGIEFRDACINDWGGKDLIDIEFGIKYLQNLPFVDTKRIGITGGSYGGFMTYIAMTKIPNYFKAGSAVVGISDLLLDYEETKKTFPVLAHYFEEQMGIPDNDKTRALWKDRSAVNFLEQMTGILQIIHTTNDPRCTISQAETVKNKLIKLGKKVGEDFFYEIFSNAGHGSAEISFRLEYFKKQIDFFNKFL